MLVPAGTSGATEAQYTNEEDYHQELTPEQQEAPDTLYRRWRAEAADRPDT